EVVVVTVDLFIGDRTIESVFFVALGRIKVGGRVGQLADVGDTLRLCGVWRHGQRTCAAGQKTAAIEDKMLWRGETVGHSPTAAANHIHGADPPGSLKRSTGHGDRWQVTVLREKTRASNGFSGIRAVRAGMNSPACTR